MYSLIGKPFELGDVTLPPLEADDVSAINIPNIHPPHVHVHVHVAPLLSIHLLLHAQAHYTHFYTCDCI